MCQRAAGSTSVQAYVVHASSAPTLFRSKSEARAWLSLRQAEIIRKAWEPPEASTPKAARLTFAAYAESWLAQRQLKARTREHYRWLLDEHLIPAFGKPAAGVDHLRRCADLARPVRHRHPDRALTRLRAGCGPSWAPRPATGRSAPTRA